jgi:DNA (cytosine-5)-methyltransferase 1
MNTGIIAIDLFCGAGGLTRGLLDAGIDVIAGVDFDEDAGLSYTTNNIRPNNESCHYVRKDIFSTSGEDIKELISSQQNKYFLLAGCAPCQPFSQKNNNKDKNDIRRNLLSEFGRLIRETNPDMVFMENVPGLQKNKRKRKIFNDFLITLQETGFKKENIDFKVINAKDYGVPQSRKRFILLASKYKKITFPEPTNNKNNYQTVKHTISSLPTLQAGERHDKLTLHKCAGLADINLQRLKIIKKDRTELPEHLVLECHKKTKGHKDAYGRMDWDKPAPTLTTKFFSISNGRYAHPEQNRAISLLEGALLQSFNKNYIFFGNTQTIARQIGNAVPPVMAKNLAKNFF